MESNYHDKTGRFFTIRKYDNEWIFVSQWTGEVNAMTLRGFVETIKSLFVQEGAMTIEEKICKAVMLYASECAGRVIKSMDEVDIIYSNKECSVLNDYIDYILYGE